MPDFISSSWHGILAPAGTPQAVVRKLNGAIVTVPAAPDLRENLVNQGTEVIASSPDEFAQFLRADLARWRKVITDAGVKPERHSAGSDAEVSRDQENPRRVRPRLTPRHLFEV